MTSDLSQTPFSFLFTAGPNGSLFVHSLFDAHPEVLTIPTFMDYYGFFERHCDLSPQDLTHTLMYKTQPISALFLRKNTSKAGDFRRIALDNGVFQDVLINRLTAERMSAKSFLVAIHVAYAAATGRDLSRIRRVLVHNHYLQPTARIVYDFPESNLIVSMRSPKGTIYSYYRTIRENFGGYVPSHLILRKLRNLVVGWELLRDVFVNGPNECLVVRLEDLHSRLTETYGRIAETLGVNVVPGAVESTLGGQPYLLSTASNVSFSGANPSVVAPKYREELGPMYERFVESFATRVLQYWSYPMETGGGMDLKALTDYRFPDEQLFNPLADMARVAATLDANPLAETRLRRFGRLLPASAEKWVAAAYRVPFRINDGQLATLLLPLGRQRIMERAERFNHSTTSSFGRNGEPRLGQH